MEYLIGSVVLALVVGAFFLVRLGKRSERTKHAEAQVESEQVKNNALQDAASTDIDDIRDRLRNRR